MKILFTGGGTGGHILPIIAVARELRRIYSVKDLEFFYAGPKDSFVHTLLSQEEIKVKNILSGKIRRYSEVEAIFQNIIDVLIKIPLGTIQAIFYIFFLIPDVIFSKGGYGSIPIVIAGWLMRTPIFLHESDIAPGLANRFLSKFSIEIFVSFPVRKTEYFKSEKIISVGNPIRKEILEGTKKEGEDLFKLRSKKPVILILGGSQGSQRINDKILEILPEILKDFEVIHQCGEKNFDTVLRESKVMISGDLEKHYHLYPFLQEMELAQAYAASELVVSRAGSGSIFEIAAVGKPSILIPLTESAQDHQLKNAYTYAENEACAVLEEANFTAHFFLARIKSLFADPDKLKQMSKNAKDFAKPESAKVMAYYLADYLNQ